MNTITAAILTRDDVTDLTRVLGAVMAKWLAAETLSMATGSALTGPDRSGSRAAHGEQWIYSRRIGLNATKAELKSSSDKAARPTMENFICRTNCAV